MKALLFQRLTVIHTTPEWGLVKASGSMDTSTVKSMCIWRIWVLKDGTQNQPYDCTFLQLCNDCMEVNRHFECVLLILERREYVLELCKNALLIPLLPGVVFSPSCSTGHIRYTWRQLVSFIVVAGGTWSGISRQIQKTAFGNSGVRTGSHERENQWRWRPQFCPLFPGIWQWKIKS